MFVFVQREDMVRRRVCSAVKGRLVVGNIPVNEGGLGGGSEALPTYVQEVCDKR